MLSGMGPALTHVHHHVTHKLIRPRIQLQLTCQLVEDKPQPLQVGEVANAVRNEPGTA